jgi:hypothetical protein
MILGRPIDMSNLGEAYDEVLDVKDGHSKIFTVNT